MPTWASFTRGVGNLQPLGHENPVDLARLQLSKASAKQVASALRGLGLLDGGGRPDFRLLRLVNQQEFSPLSEALAEHFPWLTAALDSRSLADVQESIDALDAPASSKKRFYRFVSSVRRKTDQPMPEGMPTFGADFRGTEGDRPTEAQSSASPPPQSADIHTRATSIANQILMQEADAYVEALRAALATSDFETAESVSQRLAHLRKESRSGDSR
jgi:hypothetical protein